MTNRLSRTACYVGAAAISIVIGGVIAPTSASAVTTLPALSDGQGNPVCFEDRESSPSAMWERTTLEQRAAYRFVLSARPCASSSLP